MLKRCVVVRHARVVVPEVAHHVTQRGNNKQDVFFTQDDRMAYLDILAEKCELYVLVLHGYCLMTNHVHLIVVPTCEESLAKAVGRTHFRYTQHVNKLHGRSGHLGRTGFIRVRWTRGIMLRPCVIWSAIL